MTHLKQREKQLFQRSGEQQTGQFSMQEMAIFGSSFSANQRRGANGGIQAVPESGFWDSTERIFE